MSPLRFVLPFTALLAACGGPPQRVGQDAVDSSYVLGGGAFDSGAKIIVAAAPRNFGGRVAVCGVRVDDPIGAFLDTVTGTILGNGRIALNGETVLSDMNLLPVIPFNQNITGAQTTCFATETAWTDGPMDFQVVIPNFEIRSSKQRTFRFSSGDVPQIIGNPPATQPTPELGPKPGQWQRSSS